MHFQNGAATFWATNFRPWIFRDKDTCFDPLLVFVFHQFMVARSERQQRAWQILLRLQSLPSLDLGRPRQQIDSWQACKVREALSFQVRRQTGRLCCRSQSRLLRIA
ncbi:MAG: hypothetical protein ACREH8_23200, partial [Opitutaceae bacterium]